MTWWDPFGVLGGAAAKVVADSWRAMWLSVWNAGLYVFRIVLKTEDHLLTPDISEKGPGGGVFGFTFWVAAAMVVVLAAVQIGVALLRRDGASLGRVLLGVGQFVMVWAAWLGYGTAVIAACGGLNEALMKAMLGVTSWEAWQPWEPFTGEEVTEAVVATVLGILGLVLWLAAIAHFMVILARAGALLVLAATAPISAAGLVSDVGKGWFWKSLRWFHAAAFTPVLMTLVTGLGIKLASGVSAGDAGSWQAAVGTTLPAVMMVLIAAFAPLSLFKLLAFVEPGTTSGAAARSGLAAVGGLAGLLGGTSLGAAAGGSAAESVGGRSQGEAQGEDATASRFASAQRGMATALGPVGQVAAPLLRAVAGVGAAAAAVGADATNQMGVGHNTYHPEFTSGRRSTSGMGSSQGSGIGPPAREPDVGDDFGSPSMAPPSIGWGSQLPGTQTPAAPGLNGAAAAPEAGGVGGGAVEAGVARAAAAVVV